MTRDQTIAHGRRMAALADEVTAFRPNSPESLRAESELAAVSADPTTPAPLTMIQTSELTAAGWTLLTKVLR